MAKARNIGDVLLDVVTPFGGRIVVGGAGRNEYDCTQIEIIVDLGGDDLYRGPAGGAGGLRRFAVCLDFEGDDTYECLNDALGSATYGIGVLKECRGGRCLRRRTTRLRAATRASSAKSPDSSRGRFTDVP